MIKFREAVLIKNKAVLFISDVSHEEKEHYVLITIDEETIKIPYSNIACIACIVSKAEKVNKHTGSSISSLELESLAKAENNLNQEVNEQKSRLTKKKK
jgi:hypothetical protein